MKKGINGWTFEGMDIATAVDRARAAGFEVFEAIIAPEGELTPTTPEAEVRRIGDAIRAAGMQVTSVATKMWFQSHYTAGDPAVREAAIDLTIACLDRTRWLGADALLVVPGLVRHDAQPRLLMCGYQEALSRTLDALVRLVPEAERRGVVLAMENLWNAFLLSPVEWRDLIDRANAAWVGAYLDVGNALKFGMPEDWIRILGRRIVRVHAKDFKVAIGNREGFVPLGDGDANWPQIMSALAAVGYGGPLIYEGGGDLADISRRMGRIIGIASGR